jgi:hypothetical protein
MSEQPPVRRVMISSTALDLPEHRRQASEACLRMTMFPLAMEHMPASPADALTLSREYVDQADFYLGIFAFRYGFVLGRARPHERSPAMSARMSTGCVAPRSRRPFLAERNEPRRGGGRHPGARYPLSFPFFLFVLLRP